MRFSLRDLFWLTLVAAVWTGWWLHCRKLNTELKEFRHNIALRDLETRRIEISERLLSQVRAEAEYESEISELKRRNDKLKSFGDQLVRQLRERIKETNAPPGGP